MLLIIIGGLAWNILPFLASIIGMLIFAFLFTTIFLQGVDRLERYTKSRGLGVFLIKKLMSSVDYYTKDGKNHLEMTKELE